MIEHLDMPTHALNGTFHDRALKVHGLMASKHAHPRSRRTVVEVLPAANPANGGA